MDVNQTDSSEILGMVTKSDIKAREGIHDTINWCKILVWNRRVKISTSENRKNIFERTELAADVAELRPL
jgi:hypothetical protein